MSRQKPRPHIPGIGLPDPSVEVWREETTIDEAGPRAGLPRLVEGADPTRPPSTYLALSSSGPQTDPIEVRVGRGGLPTRDSSGSSPVTQAAGLLWRPPGEDWRGWDPPRTISRWEHLEASLASEPSTSLARDPDAILIEDGTLITVYEYREATAGPWHMRLRRRRPGDDDVVVDLETFDDQPPARFRPTICQLPDGRLMLYRYLVRGAYSGLRMWYSTDDGVTWVWGGDGLVDESLASGSAGSLIHPGRIRVRASGQTLCMVALTEDTAGNTVILQYASSDGGNHFQRVHVASVSDVGFDAPGDLLALAPAPGGGYVIGVRDYYRLPSESPGDASGVSVGRIPHPTLRMDAAEWQRLDSSGCQIDLATDEGGVMLALVARCGDAEYDWRSFASHNGGRSWPAYFLTSEAEYDVLGGYTLGLRGYSVRRDTALVAGRGRGALIHRWVTGSSSIGWAAALGCAWLGGWTTRTRPLARASETELDSSGWMRTYLPIRLPSEVGYTDLGTGTRTIEGEYLRLQTGAGILDALRHAIEFTTAPAVSLNQNFQARFIGRFVAGTESEMLRIQTAAPGSLTDVYELVLLMTPSQFRLFSGGSVSSSVGLEPGRDVEIIVELAHPSSGLPRTGRSWWRYYDDTEDRAYQEGPSVTPESIGSVPQSFIFGIRAVTSSLLGREALIRSVDWSQATPRYSVDAPPTGLLARLAAGRPYLGQGVYVQARQGPAYLQERWTIDPDPDFSLNNAVIEPSPRIMWRSTAQEVDGVDTRFIALKWATRRSTLLAVAVQAANVDRMVVNVWDGAWSSSLGDIKINTGNVNVTRSGRRVVTTSTPSGGARYVAHGELVGGWYVEDGDRYRIVHNTEGVIGADTEMPITIEVDAPAGTYTGTARIDFGWSVGVIDLSDYPQATGIRLGFDVRDGYVMEAGTIAARWLYPVGMSPEWRTAYTEEAHTEGARTRDRLWRGVTVAPSSRSVSLEWPTIPEFCLDPGSSAVVPYRDERVAERGTARALAAYLRQLDGEAGSLLWIHDLPDPALSGDVLSIPGRRGFLLGRLAGSSIEQQEQPGSMPDARVVSGGSLSIEEDV